MTTTVFFPPKIWYFLEKNYSADILSMLMSNGAKLRKLEGLIGLKMKNYVKSTLAFRSRFSKNKSENTFRLPNRDLKLQNYA